MKINDIHVGEYTIPRWWFQIFCIFTPKLGEDEPILTNIFQRGWNHQPDSHGNPSWVFCMSFSSSQVSPNVSPKGARYGRCECWEPFGFHKASNCSLERVPVSCLLTGKLTCPLKINGWKMYFLLKYSLLRGHVSFRGCRIYKESIIKGLLYNWLFGVYIGNITTRWWQLKHFLFSPLTLGKWSNLTTAYFSNGLVQLPTRRIWAKENFGPLVVVV